ncbi:ABC transporter ATP-binding protein [symbiont of Argiope bruennichi]|uniref:ABC transporter ATP-binding protein n=1 Tax=symbiont of Argiope bruennichi TaxID=2810479 RepID=UPI003DA22911
MNKKDNIGQDSKLKKDKNSKSIWFWKNKKSESIPILVNEKDKKLSPLEQEKLLKKQQIDAELLKLKEIKREKSEIRKKLYEKNKKIREEGKVALKKLKETNKKLKSLRSKHSKEVIKGKIVYYDKEFPLSLNKYCIELNNVGKSYYMGYVCNKILDNFSLKIEKNKIISILGPSGSGKTTLLNIMSGLDTADSGDVFVDGYNLTLLKDNDLTKFRRRKIGFVFQQYNLLPHLTAKENAEVGENLADKKSKIYSLTEIFKTIDMLEHIDKYPYQLSGGQQQRVSIARALAKNPVILFCDEPTGALDEKTGRKVLEVLISINQKLKTTIIIVTHNPNIAELSDYVIKVGNGKIVDQYENLNKKSPQDISWS